MSTPGKKPGRPKTSKLSRAEQLRIAKRAQRVRDRKLGLSKIELRLPNQLAARLRIAMQMDDFDEALDQFLNEQVLDLNEWPVLKELAWNRALQWLPAQEALSLYERNWRFVDPEKLTEKEARLIDSLKHRFGSGVLNV